MTSSTSAGATPGPVLPVPASLRLAVVAAHRRGLPLHPQLVSLGARFVGIAMTAPRYRLLALSGGGVARGGIWWAGASGASVEVELHDLPLAAVGELVTLLPVPLAVGRVELACSSSAAGLLCTHRPVDAVDVTSHVSWPRYLATLTEGAGREDGTGSAS